MTSRWLQILLGLSLLLNAFVLAGFVWRTWIEPPHFARQHMDLSDVATSIASEAAVQAAPVVVQQQRTGPSPLESPLIMVMMVLLGASLLGNLVLVAMVLMR